MRSSRSSYPQQASGNKIVARLPSTTRAAQAIASPVRDRPTPSIRVPQAIAEPSSVKSETQLPVPLKSARHAHDPRLLATLSACLDEVRQLDFRNAELERSLRKAEDQIRVLTADLGKANVLLEQKAGVEETNLRLQAKLLALERSNASGNSDYLQEKLEEERSAYKELEKQYKLLDGYYNELLQYLRESEGGNAGDASDTREPPADATM